MSYIVYGIWFVCGFLCHRMIDSLHTRVMRVKFNRLSDSDKERILKTFNDNMKQKGE